MSEQENAKIAQSIFNAINAHDPKAYKSLQADNFQQEYAPATKGTLNSEQSWGYVQSFITALPDLHFEVTCTVAQGDRVDLYWTAIGTHTGPLRTPTGSTIPPTGKRAITPGISTFEIRDGKIARASVYWDMVTFLEQLGLMPAM